MFFFVFGDQICFKKKLAPHSHHLPPQKRTPGPPLPVAPAIRLQVPQFLEKLAEKFSWMRTQHYQHLHVEKGVCFLLVSSNMFHHVFVCLVPGKTRIQIYRRAKFRVSCFVMVHPDQTDRISISSTPLKKNIAPKNLMVGRVLSLWDGLFGGAMLNFRGVQPYQMC